MATITWPATMRLRKQSELEDKLLLAYSCAASMVEQFQTVSVNHLKHVTVRCFQKNCVEVTFIAPNREGEDINICKTTFEYCLESHHWTFGYSNALYRMYREICGHVVDDPKDEDGLFESIFNALVRFEVKASVEIDAKYVGVM